MKSIANIFMIDAIDIWLTSLWTEDVALVAASSTVLGFDAI